MPRGRNSNNAPNGASAGGKTPSKTKGSMAKRKLNFDAVETQVNKMNKNDKSDKSLVNTSDNKVSNKRSKQAVSSAQGESSNQQIYQINKTEVSEVNDGNVLVTVDIPKGGDHLDDDLDHSESNQKVYPEKPKTARDANSRNNNAIMVNDSETESV